MKNILKSLEYSLSFDLSKDKFIFKRTCKSIENILINSGIDKETLLKLENILVSHDISEDRIEELQLKYELEVNFGDDMNRARSDKKFIENMKYGLNLLETIQEIKINKL